jgi:hypothetical protein
LNKHTPGPWHLDYPHIHSNAGAKLIEVDEYMCCTVHDAQLMTSAPELLDALRDLLDVMTGQKAGELAAIHNAVLAINKATGAVQHHR